MNSPGLAVFLDYRKPKNRNENSMTAIFPANTYPRSSRRIGMQQKIPPLGTGEAHKSETLSSAYNKKPHR